MALNSFKGRLPRAVSSADHPDEPPDPADSLELAELVDASLHVTLVGGVGHKDKVRFRVAFLRGPASALWAFALRARWGVLGFGGVLFHRAH